MNRNLLYILLVMALAMSGCVSAQGKQMKSMELNSTMAEVQAQFGQPYKTEQKHNHIIGYWRMNPNVSLNDNCAFGPNCFTCARNWEVWRLSFERSTKLLMRAERQWFSTISQDKLGEVGLYGISAKDCRNKADCWNHARMRCQEMGRQNPPNWHVK